MKTNRSVVFLMLLLSVVITDTVTGVDYEVTAHEIPLDFLIDEFHASLTMPNGDSHLFSASASVYHWYFDGSKWMHERIFDLPETTGIEQLECSHTDGRLYVFMRIEPDAPHPLIQIDGMTGNWQVSYPDWIGANDRMLNLHADTHGRIYCVCARPVRADRYFLIFNCLEGDVWGDPVPIGESNGRAFIGSTGDSVHCFFYGDGFINHARIIDQHPTIERVINYQPEFDLSAVYHSTGDIDVLIQGYEPVLIAWTDSTGWRSETVAEIESATSSALVADAAGGLRIIASFDEETMMFTREGIGWTGSSITSDGRIEDLRILEDGSIRFLLSGYSYSYWTLSGGHWTRDFVFASLNCADFSFSFSEPGVPYIVILNPEAVIQILDPLEDCSVVTTEFDPMPTRDKGCITIENIDVFHALTWREHGASGLTYHRIENGDLESELITNEATRNALIGIDQELNPHTLRDVDDGIIGSWKTEGSWQNNLHFMSDFVATKSMIRDPSGNLTLAILLDEDQSNDTVSILHLSNRGFWYGDTMTLDGNASAMTVSLGSVSEWIPEILVPVYYGRMRLMYPGAVGWVKWDDISPVGNNNMAPQLCMDAFRNPVACMVPDKNGVTQIMWHSSDGWSVSTLNLGDERSYCTAKARMCQNDSLGCRAVVQTEDGRFHIIELQKQVPWFELGMQQPFVSAYVPIDLDYFVRNGPDAIQASGVILMEVPVGDTSIFYNVPDFTPTDDGLTPFDLDLAPFEFRTGNILFLELPDSDAPSINLVFWGAILDRQLNELMTDIARLDWGFNS